MPENATQCFGRGVSVMDTRGCAACVAEQSVEEVVRRIDFAVASMWARRGGRARLGRGVNRAYAGAWGRARAQRTALLFWNPLPPSRGATLLRLCMEAYLPSEFSIPNVCDPSCGISPAYLKGLRGDRSQGVWAGRGEGEVKRALGRPRTACMRPPPRSRRAAAAAAPAAPLRRSPGPPPLGPSPHPSTPLPPPPPSRRHKHDPGPRGVGLPQRPGAAQRVGLQGGMVRPQGWGGGDGASAAGERGGGGGLFAAPRRGPGQPPAGGRPAVSSAPRARGPLSLPSPRHPPAAPSPIPNLLLPPPLRRRRSQTELGWPTNATSALWTGAAHAAGRHDFWFGSAS
jgi:hypothetical protein